VLVTLQKDRPLLMRRQRKLNTHAMESWGDAFGGRKVSIKDSLILQVFEQVSPPKTKLLGETGRNGGICPSNLGKMSAFLVGLPFRLPVS